MQREKIEFPTNTPVVLKLDWNEGTLKPGRFGDEYMYVCDDDARIMFVKPELHTLIQQSGARAGDEIAITKREVKDGGRRRTQWEVEKVEEEPAASQAAAASPPAPPPSSRQAQPPARAVNPPAKATAPQPAPQLAAQLCEAHREVNCALCAQSEESPEEAPLARALRAAIQAAAAAETHAAGRGLAIRFTGEDVRAMALTLLIDANRRAR
jgi:hypothetical protein